MITFVGLLHQLAGSDADRRAGASRRAGAAATSDDLDADAIGVSGKCLDVGSISGEDRASWFGNRDHQCVDSRAGTGTSAEFGSPAGDVHTDGRFDDARLQKSVGLGIAAGIAVQRLDEHQRGNEWWP